MKLGDATIAQIVAGYELAGMNEFALAEQLDIPDPDDVVAALMLHSEVYKERNGHSEGRRVNPLIDAAGVINSREYESLRREYTILAKTAENELVREKAIRWLMDDAKGRNDVALEMLKLKKLELTKTSGQEERLAKFETLMREGLRAQHRIDGQPSTLQLVEKTA